MERIISAELKKFQSQFTQSIHRKHYTPNTAKPTWKMATPMQYVMRSRCLSPTMSYFVQSSRRTSTSTFQDHNILLWSNCMVPALENWFRRSRTTQTDMLFNETYNSVNHLIPSVRNQNKWFMKLGTSNCVNYSMCNPKRSAKYVYHTGTSASSTARAGTSCEKEQRRRRNSSSTEWTSFLFLTTTKRKADLTGTVTGRSQETRNITPPISSRRSVKRRTSKVSTIDLYEMTNSAGIWLKLVKPKIFVAKWMILRTKITPTISPKKKLTITRVIGGFVRTRLVPIPCQSGTDLTSNKHCLPCGS